MKPYISLAVLFLIGCGANHDQQDPTKFQLVSGKGCLALEKVFETDIHPFLKQNCANCHIPGGAGKGAFAGSDSRSSWSAFEGIGFDLITERAVSPTHQPPFTGTQHQSHIDGLVPLWQKALTENSQCLLESNGSFNVDPTKTFSSTSKSLQLAMDQKKVLKWNLNTEFQNSDGASPNISSGEITLEVKSITTSLGTQAYLITRPTGNSINDDMIIEGIKIFINGFAVANETTFDFIYEEVRKGNTSLLSAGTLVAVGPVQNTDHISIQINYLEVTTLPPVAMGPYVSFENSSITTSTESGTIDIAVILSAPSTDFVTSSLLVDSTTTARSIFGDQWNNFDWDYITNTLSLVFRPGETRKTIRIQIADDERDEIDEILSFKLGKISGGIKGSQDLITITIPDDDGAPSGLAPTFSQLMSAGGILARNCMSCHNSNDREGGYELSNYQEMIDSKVLIPFDVNSKMFRRMNGMDGLPPMPFSGLLEDYERRLVELWILDGAKNN